MERSGRLPAAVGGRELLLVLGGFYVVLSAGYPLLPGVGHTPLGVDLVMLVLVGVPGLVLLYGGYRLPRTDIRPEVYGVVARWCVGGIGVMLGLLGLVALGAGLRDAVQNVLILTALGGGAGFAAGIHDARAKTRELELQETVSELRTANERLEQFVYGASHDLQEPLRMVSSYVQLLENRYGDELDEEAREFIEYAVGGADRMRALVDSLDEYSRVATGGDPLEPTDTGVVLDEVLDDLQLRIEESGATITTGDLPTVRGDPDQLARVFRNGILNALTYSGNEPPTVHVGAERRNDAWQFSIADEGVGIDPEYHDRIFEVFEQLHAGDEASPQEAGGMGLAVCERIVERHGGKIWIESAPGEGTTLHFTIPTTGAKRSETVAEPVRQ